MPRVGGERGRSRGDAEAHGSAGMGARAACLFVWRVLLFWHGVAFSPQPSCETNYMVDTVTTEISAFSLT